MFVACLSLEKARNFFLKYIAKWKTFYYYITISITKVSSISLEALF